MFILATLDSVNTDDLEHSAWTFRATFRDVELTGKQTTFIAIKPITSYSKK